MAPSIHHQLGARRCAVCGTFIRDGVVCPEHRVATEEPRPSSRRTVEELPLQDMAVPSAYQRELKEHLVRRIVREFDPDLLGLLVVVRDDEGGLWILDGQHRWMVLVELGYETALCEVLHGVSVRRQAAIFSGRNSARIAPHPRDAFRADYVARRGSAVAIVGALSRHGYRPPFGGSRAAADRFVCIGTLRDVHGWGVLEPVLALIRSAWPTDAMATQAPILAGLAAVLRTYPQLPPREFGRRLARHSPVEILRLARATQVNNRERRLWVHAAAAMVDLYNRGRTAAHRLPPPQVPYDAARRWKEAGR